MIKETDLITLPWHVAPLYGALTQEDGPDWAVAYQDPPGYVWHLAERLDKPVAQHIVDLHNGSLK